MEAVHPQAAAEVEGSADERYATGQHAIVSIPPPQTIHENVSDAALTRMHTGVAEAVLSDLSAKVSPRVLSSARALDEPRRELEEYFAGGLKRFGIPLDWRLTRVESYGKGAGARFRSDARFDRFGWGELNFLEVDYPRKIVGVGRGGKYNRIETYAEWTLEAQGADATRVTLTWESTPPMSSDKLIEAVAGRKRWFRRGAKKALRRLRTILEEDRRRGARPTVAGL